jgi:hypothetical protein
MEVSGQQQAPGALSPRKNTSIKSIGGSWGPTVGLDILKTTKTPASTGIQTLELPARKLVATPDYTIPAPSR